MVGVQEFFLRPAFDGDRANVVGVIDVEDNNVRVAPVGDDGEAACLVAGDDAIDGMDLQACRSSSFDQLLMGIERM